MLSLVQCWFERSEDAADSLHGVIAPKVADDAFIAEGACLIGDVTIGPEAASGTTPSSGETSPRSR